MQFDKNADIEIACTQCGEQTVKKLGWLQDHKDFPCGKCGEPILSNIDEILGHFSGGAKLFGKGIRKHRGKFIK